MRFVVVGGGIAGSFASYYLLKEGHEVVLIDGGGRGIIRTSAYNSGMLSSAATHTPIFSNSAVRVSRREMARHPAWFARASRIDGEKYDSDVARLVPRSVELYREFLRGKESEVDLLEEALTLYHTGNEAEAHRRRFGGRTVDRRELGEMGYRWPGIGVLGRDLSAHTGKLLDLLKARIEAMGVRGMRGTAKLKCSSVRGGSRIGGAIMDDGRAVTADAYVVAAGSWSGAVCSPLGFDPCILPARGLVEFCTTRGTRLVDYPATFPELTITQHDEDTVRLTGLFELTGFNGRFGEATRTWLLETAKSFLSRSNGMELSEVGAGFRPCTPDQLPVVGAIPGCSNGFIASGASRKGVTLAPLMGRLVARSASAAGAERSDADGALLEILSPSRFFR